MLRGGYVEAGDRGRFRVEPGDVLLHDRFDAHQDQFGARGADIFNLPLPEPPQASFGRTEDPDRVVRTSETDPAEAAALLLEELAANDAALADWPDLLASDLAAGRVRRLDEWAEGMGLAPSTVSRGFKLAYGISPQRFRLENRAGRAARALERSHLSVASIAADSGFADQPHLTRTLRALLGHPPARLRARVNCIQDEAPDPA
ncbi:MAG TPA: helix-turn-helix transcriptional regulator [Allosphingosinicella sp.]|nr:helix-turn-helix transcriptional regulator [Allosphingosinicella sp.]